MTIEEMLADAETPQHPEYWPRDPDDAKRVYYRLAGQWGCLVALGHITLDEAYLRCRVAAEGVQVSTAGNVRWQQAMQFATEHLDDICARAKTSLAVADAGAARLLRRVAVAALAAGAGDADLRNAIADAAERLTVAPPPDLLHQAYHQAIAEVRGNARWIASRTAAT